MDDTRDCEHFCSTMSLWRESKHVWVFFLPSPHENRERRNHQRTPLDDARNAKAKFKALLSSPCRHMEYVELAHVDLGINESHCFYSYTCLHPALSWGQYVISPLGLHTTCWLVKQENHINTFADNTFLDTHTSATVCPIIARVGWNWYENRRRMQRSLLSAIDGTNFRRMKSPGRVIKLNFTFTALIFWWMKTASDDKSHWETEKVSRPLDESFALLVAWFISVLITTCLLSLHGWAYEIFGS